MNQKSKIIEDFPAIVFIASSKAESNDPQLLLSKFISNEFNSSQSECWKQRIGRWACNLSDNAPNFLLVIDGINERRNYSWWRELFEKLAVSPWKDSIALLVTCRTSYWKRYFEILRHIEHTSYVISSYDNEEFETALTHHGLALGDIHNNLLPLIRKPRYFDLMIKYREKIAKSGDITVARLIYEDWRDRLQRKNLLELDDSTFQNLIRELSERHRKGQSIIKDLYISHLLSIFTEKESIINELRTGGILQEKSGHYQVNERMLIHGFGLLLVNQLEEALREGQDDLGEAIAKWLEPQSGMDIKANICEFAVLHALDRPQLPRKIKIALLYAWISSQNTSPRTAEDFTAYFPLDPLSYIELAEIVWSDNSEDPSVQELLMQTFLRWHNYPEVIGQLSSIFERWLGFVHIYGTHYQRGNNEENAEKVRQQICERVKCNLQLGPYNFADRPLTAISDDGLMRLGRAALAIISHIPREPFIKAIATGCVAEAIMGMPVKYDLFKWVISTSPRPVWLEVKQEAKRLLKTNSLVAKQAAHRLLSFEGSNEAYQIQRSLPENLFPSSMFYKKHKEDPCNSPFAWSKDECEMCVQRNNILPQNIASQLKSYCIDPELSVPDDLGSRLQSLSKIINIEEVWSSMSHTRDDHFFEEYEPCLCAYSPYTMAEMVRRIVRQADQRKELPLRQLSIGLKGHSLIFREEESKSIYKAWEKLHNRVQNMNEAEETAEYFLFLFVLKGLNAQRQLELLLSRPDNALDLITFGKSYLPTTDWEYVWRELDTSDNPKKVLRIFWFISTHPNAIPKDEISSKLTPFLKHDDSLVRSSVFKIAYFTKDTKLINAFIELGWSWNNSFNDRENHWGCLLLCEHGDSLTYSNLHNRILPSYLGYALECRGLKNDELTRYAADIHCLWKRIFKKAPDLPADFPDIYLKANKNVTDFNLLDVSRDIFSKSILLNSRESTWGGVSEEFAPDKFLYLESTEEEHKKLIAIAIQTKKEQIEAGNSWFSRYFYPEVFEQVIENYPDILNIWVDYALKDSDDVTMKIRLTSSFYESLCSILLQYKPEKGINLYWRLTNIRDGVVVQVYQSGIRLLDYALFKAPASENIQNAWMQKLEKCISDHELMKITIVAQEGNGSEWLKSYIHDRTNTSIPLDLSRAFTLLGFMESEESFNQIKNLLACVPNTWRKELLETSEKRWQTNSWAKHWFRRFFAVEDDVIAWASFRLFLKCIDTRFYIWEEVIKSDYENTAHFTKRISFLEDNSDIIKNSIEKNEKPLKENLFGQKIKSGQAWPWM